MERPKAQRSKTKKKRSFKKKVYLSSLPPSITEANLAESFAQFGKILQVKVTKDYQSGFCKAYGSIKFEKAVDVNMILEFEQKVLNRSIDNAVAKENKEDLEKDREEEVSDRRVFISNIPIPMSNSSLRQAMSRFGRLETAYRMEKRPSNKTLKYGLALFSDQESVIRCLQTRFLFIDEENGAMMFEPYTENDTIKRRLKYERKTDLKNLEAVNIEKNREAENWQQNINPEGIQNFHYYDAKRNFTRHKQGIYQQVQSQFPGYESYGLSGYRNELFKRRKKLQNGLGLKGKERVRFNILKPFETKYWDIYADRNDYFCAVEDSQFRFNRKT